MTVEQGPITRALLGLARDGRHVGDRELAECLCHACVASTGIDSAAVSLLTTTQYRRTLAATDATAAKLEDLQFALGETASLAPACLRSASSSTVSTVRARIAEAGYVSVAV